MKIRTVGSGQNYLWSKRLHCSTVDSIGEVLHDPHGVGFQSLAEALVHLFSHQGSACKQGVHPGEAWPPVIVDQAQVGHDAVVGAGVCL